jgi:hypothetical protein
VGTGAAFSRVKRKGRKDDVTVSCRVQEEMEL